MARQNTKKQKTSNGANLGFEATLWAAADKLRGNMDAAEYKQLKAVATILEQAEILCAEISA